MYWPLLIKDVTTLSLFVGHILLLDFQKGGYNYTHGNSTNSKSSLSKQELLQYHKSVLDIFNTPNKQKNIYQILVMFYQTSPCNPYKNSYCRERLRVMNNNIL